MPPPSACRRDAALCSPSAACRPREQLLQLLVAIAPATRAGSIPPRNNASDGRCCQRRRRRADRAGPRSWEAGPLAHAVGRAGQGRSRRPVVRVQARSSGERTSSRSPRSSATGTPKATASKFAGSDHDPHVAARRCHRSPARYRCQLPFMRRWVRSARPPLRRMSRCLPSDGPPRRFARSGRVIVGAVPAWGSRCRSGSPCAAGQGPLPGRRWRGRGHRLRASGVPCASRRPFAPRWPALEGRYSCLRSWERSPRGPGHRPAGAHLRAHRRSRPPADRGGSRSRPPARPGRGHGAAARPRSGSSAGSIVLPSGRAPRPT